MAVDLLDVVSEKLEQRTTLSRLEARGTVRIMLKEAGLSAKSVSSDEMKAAIQRLLPQHLERRGIGEVERVCAGLIVELDRVPTDVANRSSGVETIFGRLGS